MASQDKIQQLRPQGRWIHHQFPSQSAQDWICDAQGTADLRWICCGSPWCLSQHSGEKSQPYPCSYQTPRQTSWSSQKKDGKRLQCWVCLQIKWDTSTGQQQHQGGRGLGGGWTTATPSHTNTHLHRAVQTKHVTIYYCGQELPQTRVVLWPGTPTNKGSILPGTKTLLIAMPSLLVFRSKLQSASWLRQFWTARNTTCRTCSERRATKTLLVMYQACSWVNTDLDHCTTAAHEDCSSAPILINGKPVAFKLDTGALSQCQPQRLLIMYQTCSRVNTDSTFHQTTLNTWAADTPPMMRGLLVGANPHQWQASCIQAWYGNISLGISHKKYFADHVPLVSQRRLRRSIRQHWTPRLQTLHHSDSASSFKAALKMHLFINHF